MEKASLVFHWSKPQQHNFSTENQSAINTNYPKGLMKNEK